MYINLLIIDIEETKVVFMGNSLEIIKVIIPLIIVIFQNNPNITGSKIWSSRKF